MARKKYRVGKTYKFGSDYYKAVKEVGGMVTFAGGTVYQDRKIKKHQRYLF